MRGLRCVVILAVAALGLSLLGCSSSRRTSTVVVLDRGVVVEPKHGPPPHAPAHGYRAKHQNVDLVYNSGLGVYTVVGHRGCYYRDSRFYRRQGDGWEISTSIRGPWRTTTVSSVPNGLVAERSKSEKSHKKGKW
jgi:hypothetical protein